VLACLAEIPGDQAVGEEEDAVSTTASVVGVADKEVAASVMPKRLSLSAQKRQYGSPNLHTGAAHTCGIRL
jgi:hypothetical protein